MKIFHYYAPSSAEQRGFAMQFLGTLLGVLLSAIFYFRSANPGLHAFIIGAVLALLWKMLSTAWQLEKKARRAQYAEIGVDEKGLHLIDDNGKANFIAWEEIQETGVKGGRLNVTWPDGSLTVGAREIEDGMTLVRLVLNKGHDDQPRPKANFIPLEPI